MKRLAFVLFSLFLFPVSVWSQEVRVTSGEHATFSRIVIYFEAPVSWALGRSENGYTFEYSGSTAVFQTDEVFRFIPRRRVLGLRVNSDQNRLEIELRCECHADAFELREGQIVLDFKDGAPDMFSRFESPLPLSNNETEEPDSAESIPIDVEVKEPEIHPEPVTAPNQYFASALSNTQVEFFNSALLENLGRAMSQGLLEIKPVNPSEPLQLLEYSNSVVLSSPTSRSEQESDIRVGGISIRTQNDIDSDRQVEGLDLPTNNCPDPSLLDMSNWGDPSNMVDGLAQRRYELVSPALEIARDGLIALAKYYVWLGFGAEARAAMSLHAEPGAAPKDTREVLHVLSGIMDGLPIDGSISWRRCQGAAQIWAFLAETPAQDPLPPEKMNIIRLFEGLPDHLKRHLGPILFDQFIAVDDKDAADSVRRSMSRSTNHSSPQLEILEAQSLVDSGDVETAIRELGVLAKGSDSVALQALRLLAEVSLEHEKELPDWAIEGLRAQAAIHKNTPDGVTARGLFLSHLIDLDRIADVSAFLIEAPFKATAEEQALLIRVLEASLPKADDRIFAELAVRYREVIRSSEAPSALRTYTTARLKELGFETIAAGFGVSELLTQQSSISAPPESAGNVSHDANDTHGLGHIETAEGPPVTDLPHQSLLAELEGRSALPPITETAVSIPENQDLLDAARARRQIVNDLLSVLPEVNQ